MLHGAYDFADGGAGVHRLRLQGLEEVLSPFQGGKLVEDAVTGPAPERDKLARADAALHIPQGGEAIVDIPKGEIDIVGRVLGAIGAKLDHGGGSEAGTALGNFWAVHAAYLGEVSSALPLAAGDHLPRAGLVALEQVVRSRVDEVMGATRPKYEDKLPSLAETGVVDEGLDLTGRARGSPFLQTVVSRPQVAGAIKGAGEMYQLNTG